MSKPNLKLSVFLSIPGRLHHTEVKWPAQHQAAPSFVRFQTEVGEREPNMADNVAETLDKMNIEESKDVRYI